MPRERRRDAGDDPPVRGELSSGSPSCCRNYSALSTGGTAIGLPRYSISIIIRKLADSRRASSSVSAHSAHTATPERGAFRNSDGREVSR